MYVYTNLYIYTYMYMYNCSVIYIESAIDSVGSRHPGCYERQISREGLTTSPTWLCYAGGETDGGINWGGGE